MHFQYKFSNLLGTVYRKGNLVFSKDGNSIFVPVGNKITCYDLRNSRSHTLPVEVMGNFTALALSPNGLILIGSTDIGGLHMISVMRRRLLYSNNTKKPTIAIAFSPDGKYFATTNGAAVNVYRCSGMEKRVFNPFHTEKICKAATADVTCLDWSFDSRLLAFGSKDMMVRVFPIKAMDLGHQIAELGGHGSAVVGVHFQEETYNLYSVNRSGKLMCMECGLSPNNLTERTKEADSFYKNKIEKMFKEIENEEDKDSLETITRTTHERKWLDYRCSAQFMVPSLLRSATADPDNTNTEERDAVSSLAPADDAGAAEGKRSQFLHVTATCYHTSSGVMVVACSTGDFALLDLNTNDCNVLHSLNIADQSINSVAMNLTGDWVALGVSSIGQLLVWELRSETYVLRQQGHYKSMNVVAYSPDASCLASGGDDGKVKLWSTVSSFCYVTFSEHTDAITGISFTQSGRAVLTSSLDGTVRAFDLVRYRNFKTLTSTRAAQFSCLAVDSSGELVAAGGQDSHMIYLWSLKLGTLLVILSGHTGPVSSICFSPVAGSTLLASTAWDGTLKLWDSINTTQARESITLQADGVCVCLRPDGEQVCVSTMDGHLSMFNCSTAAEEGHIEGRRDMGLSRGEGDNNTAAKNLETKFFQSLCYSSDGRQLLAGGLSKYVCVYSAVEQLLVKKYTITENRTFEGVMNVFNRRSVAHNGINMKMVEKRQTEEEQELEGVSSKRGIKMPGARKGDMSLRAFRPEIRVTGLAFAPTGRNFVVCCTEGLLIYSQDTDWLFDPLSLDIANTPSAAKRKLNQEEWGLALMMAIRLNIDSVKQEVLETIPIDAMSVVLSGLAPLYVEGLLQFIASSLESSRHVGVYARWARQALYLHAVALKARAPQIVTTINALQRALHLHHDTLSKLCASNEYSLAYLRRLSTLIKHRAAKNAKLEDADIKEGDEVESMEDSDGDLPADADDDSDEDMASLLSNFGDSDTETDITELVK